MFLLEDIVDDCSLGMRELIEVVLERNFNYCLRVVDLLKYEVLNLFRED